MNNTTSFAAKGLAEIESIKKQIDSILKKIDSCIDRNNLLCRKHRLVINETLDAISVLEEWQ
jgi:hypothetical protein